MAEHIKEWKPSINPWITMIPVILATFICILDTTIANVALPHLAGAFSITRDESIWILTSYIIASGIIMPADDWLSKKFGRKNVFMTCTIIFIISSFMCGISKNIGFMIFSRILQGFGEGGIIPIANAIIYEIFEPKDRGKAIAVFGIGIVVAPIVGPVAGGWITDNWSWPWIFFINLPLGLLAAFLSHKFIEDPPYAKKRGNAEIDKLGFVFLIFWLTCFQIFLDKGNNADWFGSPWICWLFCLSISGFILFVHSQLKTKKNLVDLTVFKDRNFTVGMIIQIIIQIILYSSLAILPQFLQGMLGYTAYLAGVAVMMRSVGSIGALAIIGKYADKIDNRLLVATGLFLMGISGFQFGNLNLQISSANIVIPNIVLGIGLAICLTSIMNLTVMTLKNEQMTNASSIQNLLKNMAAAIGTSIVVTILTRLSQVHQYMLVGKMTELNPVFSERLAEMTTAFSSYGSVETAQNMANASLYSQLVQQATLLGYMDTFRIFGVLSFLAIPLLLIVSNPKKIIKRS